MLKTSTQREKKRYHQLFLYSLALAIDAEGDPPAGGVGGVATRGVHFFVEGAVGAGDAGLALLATVSTSNTKVSGAVFLPSLCLPFDWSIELRRK